MRHHLRSILTASGKSEGKVAAVFGFNPGDCHRGVTYLCRQQPEIPVWLFSTVQPNRETVALCERTFVGVNAAALVLEAQSVLWPRWVVLCVGTWTGERGPWLLKLAPFMIPPFRALLLNRNGDFMSGRLDNVLLHCSRWLCDRARDLASTTRYLCQGFWQSSPFTRVRNIAAAISLLVIATVLRWFRYPHRALFHRLHDGERLHVSCLDENTGASMLRYEQRGTAWRAEAFRSLVDSADARWILWRSDEHADGPIAGTSFDDMLRRFDDDRTFAVSLQSHVRGWQPILLATAPFRKLQSGESTRLLAPISATILVSRKKLATLGVPDCGLARTAWLLLFWKAAAAGWRSYAVGHDGPVSAEPEFPLQETAFILRVLFNKNWRTLGPCEPELSRGTIAFQQARIGSPLSSSERLRVLVISPFVPYPLTHGGAVRIFNLCRALSERVDFGLVAIRESGDTVDYGTLHDVFRNVWIVDIDERESDNRRLPKQVRCYESRTLRALVTDLCHNWRPCLLQVEYTCLAGLQESAAGVPSILVEHDLTFGLYRQLADHEPSESADQEHKRWLAFEQKWLSVYDGVWAVSDQEREEAIRHGSRRDRTFTVPNGVDVFRFQPSEGTVSALDVLYVGSFRHLPNLIAFEKLCAEIMPQVWARFPDTMLRVVAGPNYDRFRQMLRPFAPQALDDRVEVLGFVEDLRPLYTHSAVVVAPLVVSSGTNIKVLEAMACGKAVVSTPLGCTGLDLQDGHDVFIREESSDFARTVCDLLANKPLRLQVGGNARRTAERRFCWDAIGQRAFRTYLNVLGRHPIVNPRGGRGARWANGNLEKEFEHRP
jgi:polysaccharide biosynthesis protein PslH